MLDRSPFLPHLTALYGEVEARAVCERLGALLERYRPQLATSSGDIRDAGPTARSSRPLTKCDAILITYPDQVRQPGWAPLSSLADFCQAHLKDVVSGVHLLPFYPYSSDDGFAVIDHRSVDPVLGSWDDVARLGRHFRLMFDAVINHISVQSRWFNKFLRQDPRYRDYFIVVPQGTDLSAVVRPRTSPLLTRFSTRTGEKAVWTTFSADQVDLNYHNPAVLLQVIDFLLFYVGHGAEFIRLDAIAYLWKEFGTPCIHLPQTHRIVQLLRAVLDAVAPQVLLITETNVPHADNISYFGDGMNEAQAVYNFALPPLVLYAFHSGSARILSRWVAALELPSECVTFFNFLASHDGIGLNPARGILSEAEIEQLVERTRAHGGRASYKSNPDGTQSPYELNINYFDALSSPSAQESLNLQVDRFVTAHAIMLSLVGLPGIYFHSLFGSRGWPEGVTLKGHNRAINREKLARAALESELAQPASLRSRVFERLARLLRARAAQPAFYPYGRQRVLDSCESIFGVVRMARGGHSPVVCLHNVSQHEAQIELRPHDSLRVKTRWLREMLTGRRFPAQDGVVLPLRPYETLWLMPDRPNTDERSNLLAGANQAMISE